MRIVWATLAEMSWIFGSLCIGHWTAARFVFISFIRLHVFFLFLMKLVILEFQLNFLRNWFCVFINRSSNISDAFCWFLFVINFNQTHSNRITFTEDANRAVNRERPCALISPKTTDRWPFNAAPVRLIKHFGCFDRSFQTGQIIFLMQLKSVFIYVLTLGVHPIVC